MKVGKKYPLDPWQRYVSGVFSIILLASALILAFVAAPTVAPAPGCAAPAPDGCTVQTSELVDSTVPLFFGAASVLFALMGISGRVWTFKAGGAEVAPSLDVDPTSKEEVQKSEKAGAVEDVRIETAGPAETGVSSPVSPEAASIALWESLDEEIAQALEREWRSWFGVSVVDKIAEVKRAVGKGNHAWYVLALSPDGQRVWVRVTKGGRGGGSRAERGAPQD